ncbi:MAG: hypothetical protein KC417_12075 [Myxococcales bacterium]|nr:hypothetical protein [Myxococcales bacterium]
MTAEPRVGVVRSRSTYPRTSRTRRRRCTTCTKSTQCGNECGTCELCAGKTLADLPESCNQDMDGGTGYSCDNGEQQCPSGLNSECSSGFTCQFGCCLQVILL